MTLTLMVVLIGVQFKENFAVAVAGHTPGPATDVSRNFQEKPTCNSLRRDPSRNSALA